MARRVVSKTASDLGPAMIEKGLRKGAQIHTKPGSNAKALGGSQGIFDASEPDFSSHLRCVAKGCANATWRNVNPKTKATC